MNSATTSKTNQTLYEALQSVIQRYPDREALVAGETRVTYHQLGERADRLAAGLSQLGIGKGDKVGLILPNCVETLYAWFGLAKIGAPFVPINPQLRAHEVRHILSDSESVAVITMRQMMGYDYLAMLQGIRPALPDLQHVIVLGDDRAGKTIPLTELLMAEPTALPEETVSPDDTLLIFYTSGTTGEPKGVMFAHGRCVSIIDSMLQLFEPSYWESLLASFPLFHAAGLTIEGALFTGGKVVLMERFHPRDALRLIEKERVTYWGGAPVMIQMMLRMPDFDQYDLSSLRACSMGGSACPPELIRAIRTRIGCAACNLLGITEVTVASTTRPDDPEEKQMYTVGRPIPGMEIKIVDDERQEVPVGRAGEIACRAPFLMTGYYKRPEQTAEVLDEEGWYYTGDIGSLDEDGYLCIFDRKKDMIIRGAENIYPAEVENFLVTHPKVQMAAVIGVPSAIGGERVRAYVLPMEGAELTTNEVIDYCVGQIAAYKIPDEVRFVESLPLTPLRKVQKFKLREEALKELGERRA